MPAIVLNKTHDPTKKHANFISEVTEYVSIHGLSNYTTGICVDRGWFSAHLDPTCGAGWGNTREQLEISLPQSSLSSPKCFGYFYLADGWIPLFRDIQDHGAMLRPGVGGGGGGLVGGLDMRKRIVACVRRLFGCSKLLLFKKCPTRLSKHRGGDIVFSSWYSNHRICSG